MTCNLNNFMESQQPYNNNEVAVAVLCGQSNLTLDLDAGVNAPVGPLPNVFVMHSKSYNFVPYNTSDNQVFRAVRSNTHNPGTELARLWQGRIDGGEALPDLYIIQVGLSGNGFFRDQWSDDPNRYDFLEPIEGGPHHTSKTSLWLLAQDAIKAGVLDIYAKGKTPRLLMGALIGLEHDTIVERWAEKYNVMLGAMKAMMQSSANTTGINFIYTYPQTGDWSSGVRVNHHPYNHVLTAQSSIEINYRTENRNDIEIDIAGFGIWPLFIDNVHYETSVTTRLAEEMLTKTVDARRLGHIMGKPF